MNPPQVYMYSPSWTLLLPPSPYHPSGSSQRTSPKHPVSCIEPGLATRFIHDITHVSMPFSQIFPPSPSPTESKRLFYTSVSLLLSRTQGYCYHIANKINNKILSLLTPMALRHHSYQNPVQSLKVTIHSLSSFLFSSPFLHFTLFQESHLWL